jgi:hypothetical protein
VTFQYDLFVSYAHLDNDLKVPPKRLGWVTQFLEHLERLINVGLGEKVQIWRDEEKLSSADKLAPAIFDALERSRILLVVLSPAYLKSTWCTHERESFVANVRKRQGTGAVIVAELEPIQEERLVPAEFREALQRKFYIADSETKRPLTMGLNSEHHDSYFKELQTLKYDIVNKLKELRRTEPGTLSVTQSLPALQTPALPDSGKGALDRRSASVFLAEVTDDLLSERVRTRNYLAQHGLMIFPERMYPRDHRELFVGRMKADLKRCGLFVQLLSEVPGHRPENETQGYVAWQCEIAKAEGIPLLQWRRPKLQLDDVEDLSHKSLLGGKDVCACGIEEFKATVVESAQRLPEPSEASTFTPAVFVDHDEADYVFAEQLTAWLKAKGVMVSFVRPMGDPSQIRKELEKHFGFCQAILLVYGATDPEWFYSHLDQYNKIVPRRERKPTITVFCEAPPPDHSTGFVLPEPWLTVDCRSGLNEADLERFIGRLRS